jgi:predicted GTPase
VVNKWDLALAAAREAASRSRSGSVRRDHTLSRQECAERKLSTSGKGGAPVALRENPAHIDPGTLMFDYEKMIRAKLKFLSYAPIVFLSAKTGERAERLFALINQCADARRRRIPTPALNDWLKQEVDLQRGSTPKSRPVRIYYATQAKTAPPTFLLFTNQKMPLHFSYERFLEKQLRAKFDFIGTPVRFVQRLRKREKRPRGASGRDK